MTRDYVGELAELEASQRQLTAMIEQRRREQAAAELDEPGTVMVHVRPSDARLVAECLGELIREWRDAGDVAEAAADPKGAALVRMQAAAAERVAGELHREGWDAAG